MERDLSAQLMRQKLTSSLDTIAEQYKTAANELEYISQELKYAQSSEIAVLNQRKDLVVERLNMCESHMSALKGYVQSINQWGEV